MSLTLPSRRLAVFAAASAVVLSGCSDGQSPRPPSDVATYVAGSPGGFAASLEGTLVLEQGCTYVRDDNDVRWLPVFADTVVGADGTLTYGPDTYRYQERVALTGGESALINSDTVPGACDVASPVWRVAQLSE